jgi:ABC-type transport system substrate-binding protein
VAKVFESTSNLASKSSGIVREMQVVEQASRNSNFTVVDLNQMANTLRHESTLLDQELRRFKLADPVRGGKIVTATVLPNRLTLDPAHAQFLALNYPQKAIHETLVQFGEGAELVPGLAERWEVLEHGRLYRFHLRFGARFHNGRNVTAKDVADSFHRILAPQTDSGGKWIFRGIVGAEAVMEGKTSAAEGIHVVDERTIEIRLAEPLAFFVLLLSMPETAVVPVEEARDSERFRLQPVGAGPFRVAETREGEYIRLSRSPDYYDQQRPLVDEVEFRLDLKSGREVAEAFMRGELNLAHGIPLNVVNEVRSDPRYAPYLLDSVQIHTSYLGYDCSAPPFDRVEARQALNFAINRDRINEKIFSGLGVKAASLLPPGLLGYDERMSGYPYDPDRARTLLRQAGFSSGFRVEYWTWDTDEFNNSGMVPMIVEDLAQVGIEVTMVRRTAQEARDNRRRPSHGTMFTGNWYVDFPDADNFFFIFFHSTSNTIDGLNYHRPDFDQLIEEGRRTGDIERRAEIYSELNQKTFQEAPLVFLFHERLFVMHAPDLRSVRTYLVPPPVRYRDIWVER